MLDGFSSIDPSKARGAQVSAGTFTKIYKRKTSSRPSTKSVSINGNTVFINGKGFSVAPALQASFIEKQTGGSGASAQAAIQKAQKIEQERRDQMARQREQSIKRLEQERRILIANEEREKADKLNQEINKLKFIKSSQEFQDFQRDIKTGKVQGFSGIRLSPQEYMKQKFLIDTNIIREISSKDNILRNVDPLSMQFFVDTNPTKKEKADLVQYLKSNTFNVNRVELTELQTLKNSLNRNLRDLKKANSIKSINNLEIRIYNDRSNLFKKIITLKLVPNNYTTRQLKIFSLALVSGVVDNLVKVQTGGKKVITNLEQQVQIKEFKAEQASRKLLQAKNNLEKFNKNIEEKVRTGKFTLKDKQRYDKLYSDYRKAIRASMLSKVSSQLSNELLGYAYLGVIFGKTFSKAGRADLATGFKNVPANIKNSLFEFGELIKSNPEQAAAALGVIVLADFISDKGLDKVGKYVGRGLSKSVGLLDNLNPRVVKIIDNIIDLSRVKKGKYKTLKLIVGGVQEGAESISEQLKRQGKRVTAVSAQANQLVGLIKRQNLIRKPLPNAVEKVLTTRTRKLLKRFDGGDLSPDEIILLNLKLRKETKKLGVQAKGIDLLERSTFFDPDRLLRESRLAVGEDLRQGTLFDLITGKASLFQKKAKPQILIIDDYVEILPNTKEFIKIKKKMRAAIKKGQDPNLTKLELAQLSRWQVTPSGKLKPIGSTTYQGGLEREVTIAPGEVIRRIEKIGSLRFKGKIIPIVAVKIVKGKNKSALIKKIQALENKLKILKKSKQGKKGVSLKKIELQMKKIDDEIVKLSKKSDAKDFKEFVRDARRSRTKDKVYVTKRRTTRTIKRVTPRKKVVKRKVTPRKRSPANRKPVKRVVKRKPVKIVKGKPVKRVVKRKPVKRVTPRKKVVKRKVTPRKKVSTNKKTRLNPPIRQYKKKVVSKSIQTYYVVEKVKGKLKKLYPKPLRINDARDLAVYRIDNRLSKTAFFVPLSKSKIISSPPKKIKGYYSKNKNKVRPYRIKYGQKKQLVNGFIEKRKYFQDTKGERTQAIRARKIKTATRKIKK